MKDENIKITIIQPKPLWIATKNSKGENIDALEPRWWHKLIFWKKWAYADFFIRTEKKSIKELI